MLLRRVPGLENLRYTDREIEAMLARSARAMRRSGKVPPPDARTNALRGRADVSDRADGPDGEGGTRSMRMFKPNWIARSRPTKSVPSTAFWMKNQLRK